VQLRRSDIFVGGEFIPAHSAESRPAINPATEEAFGSVPDCDGYDVGRAVAAARAAQPAWAALPIAERGAFLAALADRYAADRQEMATLVTRQNGTVFARSMRSNGNGPVATYRAHGRLAQAFDPETVHEAQGSQTIVRREPLGVVASIVPWNVPEGILALHLAPALLAGCTVVAKPSPETSLDAYRLAEMINEVGLPPGVVNIVPGGAGTGRTLTQHPGTDKISFTGSTAAGREVAATAGGMLKSVTAELGGKSAAIVLPDADLDVFGGALLATCLANTGQTCVASTRVLAPRAQFDAVVDVICSVLRASPIGDPMDPANEFGPLVSARQRDRVLGYLASGREEGARAVIGGGRVAALPVGYYVEPTVFVDVRTEMRIFQEEIFGPVLVVVAYDDEEEAVRIANDSTYGLSGSIFSQDPDHAIAVARLIQTGTLRINGQTGVEGISGWPYKGSGLSGPRDIHAYLQLKAITRRVS
jgi:acyl-CoA reductase-like NAD-dependent aldehyde dehydrogenase